MLHTLLCPVYIMKAIGQKPATTTTKIQLKINSFTTELRGLLYKVSFPRVFSKITRVQSQCCWFIAAHIFEMLIMFALIIMFLNSKGLFRWNKQIFLQYFLKYEISQLFSSNTSNMQMILLVDQILSIEKRLKQCYHFL